MITDKKILIFDLGGVILDIHFERSFAALIQMGVPPEMMNEEDCLLNATIRDFDRGDITKEQFFDYVATACSDKQLATTERIAEVWNCMLGEFPHGKTEQIKRLREKGYRVMMLSNTNDGHWDEIERRFTAATGEKMEECFDALYLSYKMHRRKPEKEIFLELLANENAAPEDCIFFDDSEENCEAARSVGITALKMERNAPWGDIFS